MTDLAQGSYGQAWTALTELCWEAWMLPAYSQYNKPCDLLSFEHLTRGWKYCMKSKSLKAKSSTLFLGCTWPGTSIWWDSRHPRWFLSRMHTQTLGWWVISLKERKKKGDNSHQTEVIQTTLPLLKDSDRLPLFRETVGRGLLPRFRAPLQRTGEAYAPNTQTFLISKRERL